MVRRVANMPNNTKLLIVLKYRYSNARQNEKHIYEKAGRFFLYLVGEAKVDFHIGIYSYY
jgi:hypothetical protein